MIAFKKMMHITRIDFNKTTSFIEQNSSISKRWVWKCRYKKISNDKCSHLVFELSISSHTRWKSLSSLSNCFIVYALVQLVQFFSNPAS